MPANSGLASVAPTITPSTVSPKAVSGGQANLLSELSRGGAVTSGLKKVDASQMTHKNPDLRVSSVVPDATNKSAPDVKPKPFSISKKPARTELEDGNKWIIVGDGQSPLITGKSRWQQIHHH
jgi:adenylyl cyclase-associated protein